MALTSQDVQDVVAALRKEGQKVSVRAVRSRLGSGSHATIAKYLQGVPPEVVEVPPLDRMDKLISSMKAAQGQVRDDLSALIQVHAQLLDDARKAPVTEVVKPFKIPSYIYERFEELANRKLPDDLIEAFDAILDELFSMIRLKDSYADKLEANGLL